MLKCCRKGVSVRAADASEQAEDSLGCMVMKRVATTRPYKPKVSRTVFSLKQWARCVAHIVQWMRMESSLHGN